MSEFFDSLERSMQQAASFANGGKGARVVRVVTVPDPEVPAIRA